MRSTIRFLILLAALAAASGAANASFHLWFIKQLYSNADGSVQFVELTSYASGQQFIHGHTLRVTQGGNVHSFTVPSDLPGDTANMADGGYGYYMPMASYKSMVIGTQGFAALNMIQPDYVVPNGFFFTTNATVNWGEGADIFNYSSLPTDGSNALNRDMSTGPAMPLNFMGDSAIIHVQTANTPAALSGLFWNANESGWGIHFTQRGSNVFAAWYTYDAQGNPKWYVSTCAMAGGATGTSGTCSGQVYEVNGPTFFSAPFDPARANATANGNLQVTFQDANNASMSYTGVAGQSRTVAITRQPLANGTPPGINYTDIWWGGASQSGWGLAITQQASTVFLAWYVYDDSGKPTWYVATCSMSGTSCGGSLLRTTGPAWGPTFDSSQVHFSTVGTISVNFSDGNDATISYTVNGVTASKTVMRQIF